MRGDAARRERRTILRSSLDVAVSSIVQLYHSCIIYKAKHMFLGLAGYLACVGQRGAVYISMADSYTLYTAHRCGTCNDVRRRGRRARRRIRIERVDRVLIIANSSCTPFTSTSSSRLKLEHHRTQHDSRQQRSTAHVGRGVPLSSIYSTHCQAA